MRLAAALRLALAALLLLAGFALPAAARELAERERLEDFDALWQAIDRGYAYFDASRPAWRKARTQWRPRAARARTREQFVATLEGLLAQLHDDHVWISERAPGSPRRVPAETDIWAAWRDDAAVIEAVRTYGDADVAGLRAGHVVRAISGLPAPMVVRDLVGTAATPTDRDWALRHALAGPQGGVLRVETAEARGPRAYEVERTRRDAANGPPLIARRVGEQRDLGYVRLKAPLSDRALAGQFAAAMAYLSGTRALILDLRDATGPFDDAAAARATTIAILQRFATKPAAWQARESRPGERETDSVRPHAHAYPAPVVVLVDRWTAGEGEALAAGLQAVARARLVGTRMAGLRGELAEVRLAHSGIALRYPAQKTFHVDGTPREALRPDHLVDLAAPQGGPGDPILYQALKLLERAGTPGR